MKKKNVLKQATALTLALGICLSGSMTAFAGTWQQLEGGESWQWKYVEDNGSYTTNNWQQIDGKWYHFDADGYLDVGMKKIDGKMYNLMKSGAMEVNHDYGFGYIDENGVWNIKEPQRDSEVYYLTSYLPVEACKEYGIDIYGILDNCDGKTEYTYSCSSVNFPKDSEGTQVNKIAVEAIEYAIQYSGAGRSYSYKWSWDESNDIFTIKFTATSENGILYDRYYY